MSANTKALKAIDLVNQLSLPTPTKKDRERLALENTANNLFSLKMQQWNTVKISRVKSTGQDQGISERERN